MTKNEKEQLNETIRMRLKIRDNLRSMLAKETDTFSQVSARAGPV